LFIQPAMKSTSPNH